MTNFKKDEYQYTKLSHIKEPKKRVNIYGIVKKIVKENGTTGRGKYHSIYDLVDDSVSHDEPFRVHLFVESSDIASHIELGSILRLHRLEIEEFNTGLDGRIQFARDLAVFPLINPSKENVFTAAKTITFTDYDKKRLDELREMEQVHRIFQDASNESSINEVSASKGKESEALDQQMDPSVHENNTESLLEETENHRLTFKMKRPSPKRKQLPVNDNDIPSKTSKVSPSGSVRVNGITINLACGKDRYLNPSSVKPEKKIKINPSSVGEGTGKPIVRNECSKKEVCLDTGNNASKGNETDSETSTGTGKILGSPTSANTKSERSVTKRSQSGRISVESEKGELEGSSNCVNKVSNGIEVANLVEKPIDSSSSPEANSAIFISLPHIIARTRLNDFSPVNERRLQTDNEKINDERSSPVQHRKENCNSLTKKTVLNGKASYSASVEVPLQTSPQKTVSPSSRRVNRSHNAHPPTPPSSEWISNDKNQTFVGRSRRIKKKEAVVQIMSLVRKDFNSNASKDSPVQEKERKPQDDTENEEKQLEDNLCSASKLAQQLRANSSLSNRQDANNEAADSNSIQDCPGLACVGKDCDWPGPLLLEDSDPRMTNFKVEELITDSLGDIPEVDENGTAIFKLKGYMSYGDGHTAQDTSISLSNFKWPKYRAKIKIIKIKPSLRVLQASGPKNFVSGGCAHCGCYCTYSHLKWYIDHKNGIKKPMCPLCFEDGRRHYVALDFRIELIARDAWGTELALFAVRNHAARFLDCSLKDYQENKDCRSRVMKRISEAISSQMYFNVSLFRVSFTYKPLFYICDTTLPEVSS